MSYDDAFVTGVGEEMLIPTSGLVSLELTIFGQGFVESNDIDFPGFPELSFLDGVPVGFDFAVAEDHDGNPTPIDDPRVLGFYTDTLTEISPDVFHLDVTVIEVPEPTSLLLLGIALGGVGLLQGGTGRAA